MRGCKTGRSKYFDLVIYRLAPGAVRAKQIPLWIVMMVSTMGLGFQLLMMSILLVVGQEQFIIPFFGIYSVPIGVFISIRRSF